MTKKLTATALLATLALGLCSCDANLKTEAGSTGTAAAASGLPAPSSVTEGCTIKGRKPSVGLVTINLQALFFNQMNKGAQTIADEAGVDLQIISGNDDSLTQTNAIEQLVSRKVDAIIVDAIDSEGIKPAVQAAKKAGIPVVAVDATIDDPAVASQVGTANLEAGKQLAEFMADEEKAKAPVGVVTALSSLIQLERQKGFMDQAKADGFTEGTVVDGRNIQENAQAASENLLTGNPDLKYVYATGEPALVGLAAAVKSQGATGRLHVYGWDLAPAAIDGLKSGWLKGIVQQDTFEFGYQAMNAAVDWACGKTPAKSIPVKTQIITPSNYQDYLYYLEK